MKKILFVVSIVGMASLSAISQKEAAPTGTPEVKQVAWESHTYLAARAVVAMKDLGAAFQDKLPKVFIFAQTNKIQVEEPAAAGLYYTWDTAAGTTDVAIAARLKVVPASSGSYSVITIPASRALLVDFYGPYDKMGIAHDAIHRYAKEKGLKLKFPAIEEYVGDPGAEADPNKVLTKVYYLIE
jgi:effector-binding domain-containing protein